LDFNELKIAKYHGFQKPINEQILSFPITIFYAMLIVCVLRPFFNNLFTKFNLEKYDFNLYNGIFMWNKCLTFGKLERKRFQIAIFS
jgi:hypothetical protein